MDESRIRQWVAKGLLNEAQAQQIVDDLRANPVTTPRTPTGVLFAAALLNGIVIYAYSFVAGVEIVAHETMGLWIVCLVPLVYALRRSALTALFSLLAAVWCVLFVYRSLGAFAVFDRLVQLPVTVLLSGLVLFSVGGLHYLLPGMRSVARPMRIVGIQLALLALFALTIDDVAKGISFFNELRDAGATAQVTATLIALAGIATGATIVGVIVRNRATEITRVEGPVTISLVTVSLLYLFMPLPGAAFSLLFTAVLFALASALAFIGIKRNDKRVLRMGGLALAALLALRVGDFLATRASWVGVAATVIGIIALSALVLEIVVRKTSRKS